MAVNITTIGASLIAVFAFLTIVLAADCAYVIWRRRRFRRRSSSTSGAGDSSVFVLSSKELLYLFCWENQSRIEPNDQVSAIDGPPRSGDLESSDPTAIGDDEDVFKLPEEAYGPSRLLFTIKEEEEATDGQDRLDRNGDNDEDDDVAENDVVLTVETSDEETTPFSTPCASPPYYTPTPSPSRDELKRSYDSYSESESSEEFSFAVLESV